jgi:hypothetical protein
MLCFGPPHSQLLRSTPTTVACRQPQEHYCRSHRQQQIVQCRDAARRNDILSSCKQCAESLDHRDIAQHYSKQKLERRAPCRFPVNLC